MERTSTNSSSSSGGYLSQQSTRSDGSRQTRETVNTSYGSLPLLEKSPRPQSPEPTVEASPRDSFATYCSTIEDEDELEPSQRGPMPRRRYQCYEPDTVPSSPQEFARLFPSSRRFMIQHDDTTTDGNLQLRLDTETSQTPNRATKKVTLFHLRMKNLQEREFSVRRYCRESGREVAAAKKKYVKSTSSTPLDQLPSHPTSKRASKRLTMALQNLAIKSSSAVHKAESGSESDEEIEEVEEDEDDRQFQDTLRTITSSAEDVVSTPTDSIRLDFSNYAQVTLNFEQHGKWRDYDFEYWGHNYRWRREKHHDDGEVVYSYELHREGTRKRIAVIMPDALGAEESQWEAKQGGWIPACSMRVLQQDISDHLADVVVSTGLIALTDDCVRRHFNV